MSKLKITNSYLHPAFRPLLRQVHADTRIYGHDISQVLHALDTVTTRLTTSILTSDRPPIIMQVTSILTILFTQHREFLALLLLLLLPIT